eukprot:4808738-Amphidinium_carterae.2
MDHMDSPVTLSSPMNLNEVLTDWCRWAHAKSVNLGYTPEQSRHHLIDGSNFEGLARRVEPDIPSGVTVFPWKWPKADEPEAYDTYKDAISVALIMDDADNQYEVPHEQLYKYNPKHENLAKPVKDVKTSTMISAKQPSTTSSSSGERAPMMDLLDLEAPPGQEEEKPMPNPVPAFTVPPIAKFPPQTIAPREKVPEAPPALPLIATPIATETCAPAAKSESDSKPDETLDMETKTIHVFAIETMHETVHAPVEEPSQEPTFGAYKKHMSSLPQFLQKYAEEMQHLRCYNTIYREIP